MADGYPRRAPCGHRARAAATILTYDLARPEQRRESVSLLVELFFDLVEVAGAQRFVEAGAKVYVASRKAEVANASRSVRAVCRLSNSVCAAF